MRDEHGGSAAHDASVSVDDMPLGHRVERRAGLVEHEHRGVGEERPRQRQTLPFAGREREAAVAYDRANALRQRRDEARDARGVERRANLRVCRFGPDVSDVFDDRRVEQHRILIDDLHVAPDVSEPEPCEGRARRGARFPRRDRAAARSRSAIVDLPLPLAPDDRERRRQAPRGS